VKTAIPAGKWLHVALIVLAAGAAGAQPLALVTEDYPPFNMLEGSEVGGISTMIIREATRRAHIPAQFTLLPWSRALRLATIRSDTCIYSAVRTPEREAHFKWIGPLVDDKIALFARSDSDIRLNTMADAKAYRVGGYVADAYADYVVRQGVPVERAPADANNLPKLMVGHIDLWVAGSISGAYRARVGGYAGRIRQVVAAGDPADTQMWLACNPGVDAATFKRLNEAVHDVLEDGGAAAYAARYR
jgi:polar amino acid transport system substrate-binding protein